MKPQKMSGVPQAPGLQTVSQEFHQTPDGALLCVRPGVSIERAIVELSVMLMHADTTLSAVATCDGDESEIREGIWTGVYLLVAAQVLLNSVHLAIDSWIKDPVAAGANRVVGAA